MPGRLLTAAQAAGYCGVSRDTLGRWARDGKIPVVYLQNRVPRYLLSDLDATILTYRRGNQNDSDKRWGPESKEMPVPVAMKMLNLSRNGIESARHQGNLPDYTYDSVRKHLKTQVEREVRTEIRVEYAAKIGNLQATVRKLRKELGK